MSLMTKWLQRRRDRRNGAALTLAPTADETTWWKSERRRLLWKAGLRQGLAMYATFTLAPLLIAVRQGHLGPGGIALALGQGLFAGLVGGYFMARVLVDRQFALSIRQKRLREALIAQNDPTS